MDLPLIIIDQDEILLSSHPYQKVNNFKWIKGKTKDFSLGSSIRQELSREFNSIGNKPFRDWYFTRFDKNFQNKWKKRYYNHLEKYDTILYFIPWFTAFYKLEQHQKLNMINKSWDTKSGIKIQSSYPPLEPLYLTEGTDMLEASAFMKIRNEAQISVTKIDNIFKQLNYTNMYLQHLSSHIENLEAYIIKLPQYKEEKLGSSSNSLKEIIVKPPTQ